MALGNQAVVNQRSVGGTPSFNIAISFDGDDNYPTGGTPDFTQFVRDLVGSDIQILAVIPGECGGFVPSFDPSNDTLLVRQSAGAAAPLAEIAATTDLSPTTFNVTVLGT